jgi:hypothetical protein
LANLQNCFYSRTAEKGSSRKPIFTGAKPYASGPGGERWHRSDRYTLLPQDVGVVDGYAGAALGPPWRSEGVERHIDQGAPHPIVTLRSPWSESTRYIFSGSCPTFDIHLPYKNLGFLYEGGSYPDPCEQRRSVLPVWYLVGTPLARKTGMRGPGTYPPPVPGSY